MNSWERLGKELEIVFSESLSILEGLGVTLLISFCAIIIGVILGMIISSVKLIPLKKSNRVGRVLVKLCDVYITFFRGTPVVVQLLVIFFVIFAAKAPALLVAIIVFGLNSGAYVSEYIRGGILAVDKGQLEASRSLGLNYSRSMMYTVLPQAVKNAVPSLGNEFITLFKETSVVSFITVIDLTNAIQLIAANKYIATVPYLVLAAIYLVCVILFTAVLRAIERRLRRSDSSK